MASLSALPRLVSAWFDQHDGTLQGYLHRQIVANARAMYETEADYEASDDGAEFEVVLLSRFAAREGFKEEILMYSAVLVKYSWAWEGKGKKRARKLRRRVVNKGRFDCKIAADALDSLAREVVRDAGEWLDGDEQEELLQDVRELAEKQRMRRAADEERRRWAEEAQV